MKESISIDMSEQAKPSAWNEHPTRNATGLYKFISYEIVLDARVKVTSRQTYDILSWLGDCGGLKDGIFGLG